MPLNVFPSKNAFKYEEISGRQRRVDTDGAPWLIFSVQFNRPSPDRPNLCHRFQYYSDMG